MRKKVLSVLLIMSLMLPPLPRTASAASAEETAPPASEEVAPPASEEAAPPASEEAYQPDEERHDGSLETPEAPQEPDSEASLLAEHPTSGVCGENLTWVFNSSGTLTISGTGKMTNYRSPVYGYAKDVPWYWVSNDITEIVIADSVTTIGDYAFYDCINLPRITISGNIVSIGTGAFKSCDNLTSVTILDGVTSIGRDAFADCARLSKIVVPASVASMPYGICSGCTGLVSAGPAGGGFNYEFSWSEIPDYAFYGCPLTHIVMPASVTRISRVAFGTCPGPKTAGPIGGGYDYEFGWTEEIPQYAFSGCSQISRITIPGSITQVGSLPNCADLNTAGPIGGGYDCEFGWTGELPGKALSGCKYLTSVTIPDSITSIGVSAFQDCTGLTDITLPVGITSIGDSAFQGCTALSGITIPNRTTSIGRQAFYHCTSLSEVEIPGSVTRIGSDAFSRCTGLTRVTILANAVQFSSGVFKGCTGLTSAGLVGGGYDYEFSWTSEIPSYAFGGCENLARVAIPDTAASIGREAFSGCASLSHIKIPDSVTAIGYCAFGSCTGLTSVVIPDRVAKIEGRAFSSCRSLTKVTLPASVTRMSERIFSGCPGLTSAGPIGGGYSMEFGWTSKIPFYAFDDCENLTRVEIPLGIKEIGICAFQDCHSLTAIEIPSSVTNILDGVFRRCSSLNSVSIPGNVTDIGDDAFYSCDSLTDIYYAGSEADWADIKIGANNPPVKSAVIHYNSLGPGMPASGSCGISANWKFEDGVLTVFGSWEMYDFRLDTGSADLPPWYDLRNRIEKVVIESGITAIGKNAFYGCPNLRDVSISGNVISIRDHAFENCAGLKYLAIPDSVQSIGDFAFGNCTGLIKVVLPANIKRIGEYTFASCENLRSVVIPDGVTEIGRSAFQGCSSMLMAVIPESVVKIGDLAFLSSGAIDVYYAGSRQNWDAIQRGQDHGLSGSRAVFHYNSGNPAAENHVIKVDMSDLERTFLNTDDPLFLYVCFDQELDQSAVAAYGGAIRLLAEGSAEPVRVCTASEGRGMDYYVETDDLTRLVVEITNNLQRTWLLHDLSAVPYGSTLTLSIEPEAVKFANPSVNFPGIGVGSDDRFSAQTKWGMTPDVDWLSFFNSYDHFGMVSSEKSWIITPTIMNRFFDLSLEPGKVSDSYAKIRESAYANKDIWKGSCEGMSSVMALAKIGDLNVQAWAADAAACYELDKPVDSTGAFGTRDLINYYQFLQYLDRYPKHEAKKNMGFIDFITKKVWDSTIESIIEKARNFQQSKTPLLIGFSFKPLDSKGEKEGHTCLAYYYSEDAENFCLGLYDPTFPDKATTIKINKKNYDATLYGGWQSYPDKEYACELFSISYTDPHDLVPYNIDNLAAANTKTCALDSRNDDGDTHAILYLGLNDDCTITNSAGEYFRSHDGTVEGTMKIYAFRTVGSGTSVEYRIEVDASDSFVCNADNSEVGFTVYQNNSYLEAATTSTDASIAIVPGKSVSLFGQDTIDYQIFSSADFENGDLIAIAGQSAGAVGVYQTEDQKIQLAADNAAPAAIGIFDQATVTEYELDRSQDGPVISAPAPVTCIITFNANSGTTSAASVPTNPDGKALLLPVAVRTGYTFNGWYTAPAGGEKITSDTVFDRDTTVYAQWDYAAPVVCEKYKELYTAAISRSGREFTLTLTPRGDYAPMPASVTVWQANYRQGRMTALTQIPAVLQSGGMRFSGTASSEGVCSLFVLDKAFAPIIEKYTLF